jgi:hypothetical protein
MKIQSLVRLFPYFPAGLNGDLMTQYRLSIQNSELKYRILFYVSEIFCQFKPKKRSVKKGIFNHEIDVLKKSSDKFILQRHLFHVLNTGTKSENEIINNKKYFHDFCAKNQLPTPHLSGIIKDGTIQSFVQVLPWDNAKSFFVKPVSGSQSKGILEFRAKGENTYEILDQNRLINTRHIPEYLKFYLKKGEFIIQEKVSLPHYFPISEQSNVPILRIISYKKNDQIKILNPVLIINKEKQFLDSRLGNKDFYAIDAADGTIIDQIVFGHIPPKLDGFAMPEWNALLELIKKGHDLLGTIKIIGWDVAIGEGDYSILEANKRPWLEIHQKSPFEGTSFIENILTLK